MVNKMAKTRLKDFEFDLGENKKKVKKVTKYRYPDGKVTYIGELYDKRGNFKFGPSCDCNSKEEFIRYVKDTFSGLSTKQDMYYAATKQGNKIRR